MYLNDLILKLLVVPISTSETTYGYVSIIERFCQYGYAYCLRQYSKIVYY